jgi:hypothetical protein
MWPLPGCGSHWQSCLPSMPIQATIYRFFHRLNFMTSTIWSKSYTWGHSLSFCPYCDHIVECLLYNSLFWMEPFCHINENFLLDVQPCHQSFVSVNHALEHVLWKLFY